MHTRRFLAALALAVTCAACGHSPTAPSARDVEARHDGGWTIGSGGRADTTGTSATTAGEMDGGCGTEESGGWTIGSGGAIHLPPSRCPGR